MLAINGRPARFGSTHRSVETMRAEATSLRWRSSALTPHVFSTCGYFPVARAMTVPPHHCVKNFVSCPLIERPVSAVTVRWLKTGIGRRFHVI